MGVVATQFLALLIAGAVPVLEYFFKGWVAGDARPADQAGQFEYEMTSGRTFGGIGLALTGLGISVISIATIRNLAGPPDSPDTIASLIRREHLLYWAFGAAAISGLAFHLSVLFHTRAEIREWPRRKAMLQAYKDGRLNSRAIRESRILRLRCAVMGFGFVGLSMPLLLILHLR